MTFDMIMVLAATQIKHKSYKILYYYLVITLVILICTSSLGIIKDYGGKYLVFESSRSVKMRGFSSVCMLFEESVLIFQFLNNIMHNYVLFNTFVHFIVQKLKNKHTFLKTEKAKFSQ